MRRSTKPPSGLPRAPLRPRAQSLLLSLSLAAAGCLDWDEQEATVAYDAEHDRLCAQLVDRGLHSTSSQDWPFLTGDEKEDVESTRKELDQLLEGRPMFALLTPVLSIDVREMAESDDPIIAALAERIEVDQGDFFTDQEGRLCGWQRIRLRDVSAALQIMSTLFAHRVANEEQASDLRKAIGCDDPESARRWTAFVASGRRWFERRDDGTLIWTLPISEPAAHAPAQRIEAAPTLERLLADDKAAKSAAARAEPGATSHEPPPDPTLLAANRSPAQEHADADWWGALLHAIGARVESRPGEGAALVLLEPGRTTTTIRLVAPKSDATRYDLAPHLESRHVKVRTDVTDATLRADFAEFRSR